MRGKSSNAAHGTKAWFETLGIESEDRFNASTSRFVHKRCSYDCADPAIAQGIS